MIQKDYKIDFYITKIFNLKYIIYNIILCILLISVFFTSKLWAITSQEVLSKFEAKLNGLKTYTLETVEKSKTIGPQGIKESSSHGKSFIKGKKRYSEINIIRNKKFNMDKNKNGTFDQNKNENQVIQVFDGTISWFYDKNKQEVKKVDFSKLPAKIQKKIKSSQDATDIDLPEGLEFDLEEKQEEKKRFYVLTSKNTVTAGSQKYEKIVLWIDAKEYLPYKLERHEKIILKIPQGTNLEIKTQVVQEFKNWELNLDIPDSKFVFTVPEGVKVRDVTKETGGIYERYMKNR